MEITSEWTYDSEGKWIATLLSPQRKIIEYPFSGTIRELAIKVQKIGTIMEIWASDNGKDRYIEVPDYVWKPYVYGGKV